MRTAHILCPTCLSYYRPEGLLLIPNPLRASGVIWSPLRHAIATDPWVASLFGFPVPHTSRMPEPSGEYVRYEAVARLAPMGSWGHSVPV